MDDADAFTAFYTAAHTTVLTTVRATLGDGALARDAVDEAFVRAAERWGQVRTMDNREGWTYRVAVNWATSWRRKWSRRPTRPVEQLDRAHDDDLPDLDLAEALRTLPVEQRQMLVLRHAYGYPVRDVAAVLGVAEGTVKSGVHRARARLRDDGRWQDHPDDLAGDLAGDLDGDRAGGPTGGLASGPDHGPIRDLTSYPNQPATRRPNGDHSEVFDGRA